MVIVRIWEGLGNQIFQYAYAKALALRTGREVLLDVRHPNRGDLTGEIPDVSRRTGITRFRLGLKGFNTKAAPGFRFLDGGAVLGRLERKAAERGWGPVRFLSDEGQIQELLPEIHMPRPEGCTYVSGHFFHPAYFREAEGYLRTEFHLRKKPAMKPEWEKALQGGETVSVHVRRGDYLKAHVTVCSLTYYRRAMELMRKRLGSPVFFFFSDDIEWAARNLECGGDCFFVSGEGYDECQELELMRTCRHHITANSTFSYWGARLGAYENGVVTVPDFWFPHLHGEHWIRL